MPGPASRPSARPHRTAATRPRAPTGLLSRLCFDRVTLVFHDIVFSLRSLPGLFGLVYGRLMGNAGRPRVTTLSRRLLVKDRRALRAHLERLAATPGLRRILVSHGEPILSEAAAALQRVASEL